MRALFPNSFVQRCMRLLAWPLGYNRWEQRERGAGSGTLTDAPSSPLAGLNLRERIAYRDRYAVQNCGARIL